MVGPLASDIEQMLNEVELGKPRRNALADLAERAVIPEVRQRHDSVQADGHEPWRNSSGSDAAIAPQAASARGAARAPGNREDGFPACA